jgi:hypothetical protein
MGPCFEQRLSLSRRMGANGKPFVRTEFFLKPERFKVARKSKGLVRAKSSFLPLNHPFIVASTSSPHLSCHHTNSSCHEWTKKSLEIETSHHPYRPTSRHAKSRLKGYSKTLPI